MDLLNAMNWRYATKRMTGAKVPQQKLDNILEAIRLSASSAGVQPYQVVVVSSDGMKKKISEKACVQPQVLECSHLLVFAPWKVFNEAQADEYISRIASVRNVPEESLAQFSAAIRNILLNRPQEANAEWAARQAYIALGHGLVAAAVEGVDSVAMEGFDAAAMDEVLGLDSRGLRSVVLLALGYRDAEQDFLANAKKVRREKEQLFIPA